MLILHHPFFGPLLIGSIEHRHALTNLRNSASDIDIKIPPKTAFNNQQFRLLIALRSAGSDHSKEAILPNLMTGSLLIDISAFLTHRCPIGGEIVRDFALVGAPDLRRHTMIGLVLSPAVSGKLPATVNERTRKHHHLLFPDPRPTHRETNRSVVGHLAHFVHTQVKFDRAHKAESIVGRSLLPESALWLGVPTLAVVVAPLAD
jgi:hypothetical protein